MNDNGHTDRPDITQYSTEKLLEDRRTFTIAASLCRTAMLFNILVVRASNDPEDEVDVQEAAELLDVLRENETALAIIDQELARRQPL